MKAKHLQKFINMSAELCGFSESTLRGTGYAQGYYFVVDREVGSDIFSRLLAAYARLPYEDHAARDEALRAQILDDEEFGLVARNIMKLWYTSIWHAFPDSWRKRFYPKEHDVTYIPFTYGYTESMLGPAVGAHVAGAKPTGYASWTEPPIIPEFSGHDRL